MTDPISDLFARIKNAWKIRKKKIEVPYSNTKIAILKILKEKNIIGDFTIVGDLNNNAENDKALLSSKSNKSKIKNFRRFIVSLVYDEDGKSPVENIIRVSKPGQKIYFKYAEFKPVRQGYGFRIISTSRGIMIDDEAKKRKLGGEVICEIN
ncbi:MAG: 30S ribosomal protein S8 [Patescibacteria group bacterium]